MRRGDGGGARARAASERGAGESNRGASGERLVPGMAGGSGGGGAPVIVDVWAGNLAAEMDRIAALAGTYNHVAVDTEFPGVVARPVGEAGGAPDAGYQTLRCNVDMLRMIQLGISLSDGEGGVPTGVRCWQFNFQFSLESDMYAEDSIELLERSGLDFKEHERNGISVAEFGELLTSSGLVLNDEVKWVSFHGGYDFAYVLKVLTATALPQGETGFFALLEAYFPQLYDVKYLMRRAGGAGLHGGLNRLADHYKVPRVGTMHTAGSDSLLTLHVFFRMLRESFGGAIDDEHEGILYGLGVASTPYPGGYEADAAPRAVKAAA